MRSAIAICLMLAAGASLAGEAKLSWVNPTECVDGTPISNCALTGIEVEHSTNYNETTTVGTWAPVQTLAPTLTSYTVPNLAVGTHFFRIRAAAGSQLSGFSNVGKKKIDPVAPKPPVLTVADSGEPAYKLDLTASNTARWTQVGKAKGGSVCKADYKVDIKGETRYMLANRYSIYNAVSYPNQVWASCNG